MLFECEQPFLWGEVSEIRAHWTFYAVHYTYFISFLLETREKGQGLPEGESPGPVSYPEYLLGYRMVPWKTRVSGNFGTISKPRKRFWWVLTSRFRVIFASRSLNFLFGRWVSKSRMCRNFLSFGLQESNFSEFTGTTYQTKPVD